MSTKVIDTRIMKVFPKGQIVIPVSLRKKYNIAIGDQIEIIPSRDGLFLKPSSKTSQRETMTDRLFGVFREYGEKKQSLGKKEISETTADGFNKGWDK